MSFNVYKCSVMQIGYNMHSNYNITNQQLPTTDQHRDLGMIIAKDLKCMDRVLGIIARNFRCKNQELILALYKFLISPHLEHAVHLSSPHSERDIDKIGKEQR